MGVGHDYLVEPCDLLGVGQDTLKRIVTLLYCDPVGHDYLVEPCDLLGVGQDSLRPVHHFFFAFLTPLKTKRY